MYFLFSILHSLQIEKGQRKKICRHVDRQQSSLKRIRMKKQIIVAESLKRAKKKKQQPTNRADSKNIQNCHFSTFKNIHLIIQLNTHGRSLRCVYLNHFYVTTTSSFLLTCQTMLSVQRKSNEILNCWCSQRLNNNLRKQEKKIAKRKHSSRILRLI